MCQSIDEKLADAALDIALQANGRCVPVSSYVQGVAMQKASHATINIQA